MLANALTHLIKRQRPTECWRYAKLSFAWRDSDFRERLPLFAIAAEAINCAAESFVVMATETGLLLRTGLVWDDGRQSSIDPRSIMDKALDQARQAVLDTPELISAIHFDICRHQYLALDLAGKECSPNNEPRAVNGEHTSNWLSWKFGSTLSVMKHQALLMSVAAQTALASAPGCAAAVRFDWDRRQLAIWVSLYLPSGITLSNSGRALFERRAETVVEQVLTKLRLQDEAFRQPGNALAN
ncbi:MAG: hypothetical protein JNJ95_12925 [Dechloromonas sp.]|nr:hypothetical protein [Dechloromonas sp.]